MNEKKKYKTTTNQQPCNEHQYLYGQCDEYAVNIQPFRPKSLHCKSTIKYNLYLLISYAMLLLLLLFSIENRLIHKSIQLCQVPSLPTPQSVHYSRIKSFPLRWCSHMLYNIYSQHMVCSLVFFKPASKAAFSYLQFFVIECPTIISIWMINIELKILDAPGTGGGEGGVNVLGKNQKADW